MRNHRLVNRVSISPLAVSAKDSPLSFFVQSTRAGNKHALSDNFNTHCGDLITRGAKSILNDQILAINDLARVEFPELEIETGECGAVDSLSHEGLRKIDDITCNCHPISDYKPRIMPILIRIATPNCKVTQKGHNAWANSPRHWGALAVEQPEP